MEMPQCSVPNKVSLSIHIFQKPSPLNDDDDDQKTGGRKVENYSKIQFTIDLSITNDSFTSSPHLGLFDGSFRNPFHILPQISFKILLYFDLFTQIGENKRVIVVRQLTLLPPHSPRLRP